MSHDEAAEVLEVSRRTVGYLIERFRQWAAHESRLPAAAPGKNANALPKLLGRGFKPNEE